MGKAEQDFFNKDSFAVMGNTRRMRDVVNGLKMMGRNAYFVDYGFTRDDAAGKFQAIVDLPEPADAAIIDGKADALREYLNDISEAGIKSVWINYESDKRDVVELAKEKNLKVMHGQCAVLWLPTKGPHHSVHRLLWKLFGKY